MDSNISKKDDSVNRNLNKSLWLTSGANFVASVLFFIAFLLLKNVWFLVAAIALFIAGIGFIYAVKFMERKFNSYVDNLKHKEK